MTGPRKVARTARKVAEAVESREQMAKKLALISQERDVYVAACILKMNGPIVLTAGDVKRAVAVYDRVVYDEIELAMDLDAALPWRDRLRMRVRRLLRLPVQSQKTQKGMLLRLRPLGTPQELASTASAAAQETAAGTTAANPESADRSSGTDPVQ